MYSGETKQKAFSHFKKYSISEISKLLKVGKFTLYLWRKQYMKQEKQYDSVKHIIKMGTLGEVECIKIAYMMNPKIQSAIVKRYISEAMFEPAISICENYPTDEVFQSQLATIYIALGECDKAICICEKYPTNEILQGQLATIKKSKPCAKKTLFFKNNLGNVSLNAKHVLDDIRLKLSTNEVDMEDVNLLKEIESQMDSNLYKFVLVALYHRLGLLKLALTVLKSIDSEYDKYKNLLFTKLTSKKQNFYDLGLYDKVIPWRVNLEDGKQPQKIKK